MHTQTIIGALCTDLCFRSISSGINHGVVWSGLPIFRCVTKYLDLSTYEKKCLSCILFEDQSAYPENIYMTSHHVSKWNHLFSLDISTWSYGAKKIFLHLMKENQLKGHKPQRTLHFSDEIDFHYLRLKTDYLAHVRMLCGVTFSVQNYELRSFKSGAGGRIQMFVDASHALLPSPFFWWWF